MSGPRFEIQGVRVAFLTSRSQRDFKQNRWCPSPPVCLPVTGKHAKPYSNDLFYITLCMVEQKKKKKPSAHTDTLSHMDSAVTLVIRYLKAHIYLLFLKKKKVNFHSFGIRTCWQTFLCVLRWHLPQTISIHLLIVWLFISNHLLNSVEVCLHKLPLFPAWVQMTVLNSEWWFGGLQDLAD